MNTPKLLLLDRDGVINEKAADGDYIKSIEELNIYSNVIELIAFASRILNVSIVSNQQGVGKGVMTKASVELIHEYINKLVNYQGGNLIRFYYCEHLKSANCECRKPKPGLLIKAMKDHSVSSRDTVFIGDQDSDNEAADAAGVKFFRTFSNINTVSIMRNILTGQNAR